MNRARDRLLLASIHDVSPRFECQVDRLVSLLEPHVGRRMAMLVVPNHWGDAPIVPSSPFAARLRRWAEEGVEIFLHGFHHRDQHAHPALADRLRARWFTAGEGEFLGLSRTEAGRLIGDGRALVEDVIGKPVAGFVAPAWLYGAGSLAALIDCGVPIAEDHWRIWSPATGALLARGPVITWASRTRPRLQSSLAAAHLLARAPIRALRVGVHPPDIHHPEIVRSIEATLRKARRNRRPSSYGDLRRYSRRDFQ